MQKEILVSIITVSYNSENTIRQTIESVLRQTYSTIEYVIIDGKSTDEAVSIAKEYEEEFKDKGYSYKIISEEDKGIYDAMNKGIGKASGELIGIINSDDWYELNAIEKVVKRYQESKFDMIYGDLKIHKSDGWIIKKARFRTFATTRDWNHPTTFITKKVYEKNLYRTESIHDDWDLMLRIRKQGYKIVVLNEVLANFRFGGVSNAQTRSLANRINEKYSSYKKNGYSPLYWFDCAMIVVVKDIWGNRKDV